MQDNLWTGCSSATCRLELAICASRSLRRVCYCTGTAIAANIVRCCQMCNSIKGARTYEWFVIFFRQFREVHGRRYRAADPDDWRTIGAMTRKFNEWLHDLQHAPVSEAG